MIDKIYVSYFYMIRFFKPNMVPLSTAIWDPKWYHHFRGQDNIFIDKRGVINGLRLNPLHPEPDNDCCITCKKTGDPNVCEFIRRYRNQIYSIDFNKFMETLESYLNIINERYLHQGNIIPVLIVHEAPSNMCSERIVLRNWFNNNGMILPELTYNDCEYMVR